MSVQFDKRSKSKIYTYDFWVGGERFLGSTGKTTKREAERVEETIKATKRTEQVRRKAIKNAGPDLTIEEACSKYWEEKEKDHAPASRPDALRYLAWITDFFECTTKLCDIGDPQVAMMVAARRGEFIVRGKTVTDKLVSNTTVNRSSTMVLQRLLNRAYKVWKIPVQIINWEEHILPEPKERVRELLVDEEAMLLDRLDRGYDVITRFANIMGTRRMECIGLVHTDVDFHNRRVRLRGKGGTIEWVPLPPEAYDILWGERFRHKTHVFTYVATQTRRLTKSGQMTVRGERYPITKYSLRKAFVKAVAEAGLVDFRWHDTRHTAATRLLRKSGNLKLAQKLMRHSDIKTTIKYAHATMDDLADAMEAIYPTKVKA